MYAALPGPHYETPAEVRMLRGLGADLVGMSTALEAIAARAEGVEVLGVSLVTNLAAGHDRPAARPRRGARGRGGVGRPRSAPCSPRRWRSCDAAGQTVARAWAEDDPDPATRDEVLGLLDATSRRCASGSTGT